MDEQNNNQNPENDKNNYIHNLDDSTLSNPFSNALKSINQFLEKINLKKPEQARIGTKETNSRGFQTTSRSVEAATSKRSLKAILRTAFENRQEKRAEKIRAKASPNKLQVHKVGETRTSEQVQDVSRDSMESPIIPLTAQQRAAQLQQARQAPNLINNTVIMAEAKSAEVELEGVPSATEIEFDETFDQNKDRNLDQSQDVVNNNLEAVKLNVSVDQPNQIITPKVKPKDQKVVEKNDDELSF